ncbi:uncharacterized protein LOC123555315 [Mercenaria mercenaria]|uniref:uncharacterized protein LOC123555315 n=1 Tax=Mercenaria mercenaria TaxID=6596 RepID=UPI00234FAC23|nr:uncharacterized protein LOC123555315 [Mercenaria mercenaria]
MILKFMKICLLCTGLFVLTTLILKGKTVHNMNIKMISTPVRSISTAQPETLFLNGKPTLVFGKNFRAHILSVLKHSELTLTALLRKQEHIRNMSEHIVVTGWIARGNRTLSTLQIYCCFYHADNRISSVKADIRKTHFERSRARFDALQCVCPVYSATVPVIKVSLKEGRSTCTKNVTQYVQVETIPKRKIDGVALCVKVLYAKLKASFMIEWFEAMRLLGVEKVFGYINKDLNNDAKNVVKYYEEMGLAKAVSFEIPENDTYTRHLDDKTFASRMDSGVPLLDCIERMHEYKYAVCLDKDEILIPENVPLKNSLKRYLAGIFQPNKTLAMMLFKTMVHVKSWDAVNPNHPLFIGRMANSTPAMWDREKYAFIPEGQVPGSCFSHRCRVQHGYTSKFIEDNSAMIHHFRSCREEWITGRSPKSQELFVNQSEGKICSNFIRVKSYTIEILADQIKHNVLKVQSLLKIGK